MKKTLMFASLASLSLALVACPNTMPSTIASVTTPAGTYTTTAAGGQVIVPVVVTRATGNTNAALTFTCSLSGTGLATAITGTAAAAGTSGGNGSCTYTVPAGTAVGTYTSTATSTVDTSKKATASVSVTPVVAATATRINVGGPVVGTGATAWAADTAANWVCYTGSTAETGAKANGEIATGASQTPAQTWTITTSGVTNAAPADVYQSNRFCNAGTGSNLVWTGTAASAGTYVARLHFAETYHGTTNATGGALNDRVLDVRVDTANTAIATLIALPNPTTVTITKASQTGSTVSSTAKVQDIAIAGALTAGQTVKIALSENNGKPMIAGVELIKQ